MSEHIDDILNEFNMMGMGHGDIIIEEDEDDASAANSGYSGGLLGEQGGGR